MFSSNTSLLEICSSSQQFAAQNFIPFLLVMWNCCFIASIPQILSALSFISEITLGLSWNNSGVFNRLRIEIQVSCGSGFAVQIIPENVEEDCWKCKLKEVIRRICTQEYQNNIWRKCAMRLKIKNKLIPWVNPSAAVPAPHVRTNVFHKEIIW